MNMNWRVRAVVVLFFVFTMRTVSGSPLQLELSATSKWAFIGRSYKLTCTVSGADALKDFIQFSKKSISRPLVTISQDRIKCYVLSQSSGYHPVCSAGTSGHNSEIKVYDLIITRVQHSDLQQWTCSLLNSKQISNSFKPPSSDDCYLRCHHGKFNKQNCNCLCAGNWVGQTCGECNATCEHSTLNEDTCVCICFGSWTGDKCERCDITCDHGTRNEENCTCDCPPEWRGARCEQCSGKCQHGYIADKDCNCLCGGNWNGDYCEICGLHCAHGGEPVGDRCTHCLCHGTWQGDLCEECLLKCEHGSTPLKNNCSCQCKGSWGGQTCDKCTLECVHGDFKEDTCTCDCHVKWKGVSCDMEAGLWKATSKGVSGAIVTGSAVGVILLIATVMGIVAYRRKTLEEREDGQQIVAQTTDPSTGIVNMAMDCS